MKSFETTCKELNKENDKIFAKVCEILDARLDDDAVGEYGCDLHNYLFNSVYAFIHDSEAEEACESVGTWSAIRLVHTYEKDNFGEISTEIEPCKIANMLVYIYGEFLLQQVAHLQGEVWNEALDSADVEKIKVELMGWLENNLPTNEHWQRRPLNGQVWDNYGTY